MKKTPTQKILALPLAMQIFLALLLGIGMGEIFPKTAVPLGVLANWILQVIKAFATSLLFFAILDSFLKAQFYRRHMFQLFAICATNSALAILLGIVLLNVFQPGKYLASAIQQTGAVPVATQKSIDWFQAFSTWIPESVVGPLVNNSVPAIILIAILFGTAARACVKRTPTLKENFSAFSQIIEFFLEMHLRILTWLVHLIPIAVFAAVGKVVAQQGFGAFKGLAFYVAICASGMALHILIVYQTWIRAFAKIPLLKFWKEAKEPVAYAFGVNSSLATLPVTLSALNRLKVSPASARLAACVGTNFNNDGILLYEVMAALFLMQAYGHSISVFQQISLALISIVATIGVAGIPEAGIISLSLVLSTLGLPLESIPLLLTVDWILARLRSVTNVLGDMTGAVALDAMD